MAEHLRRLLQRYEFLQKALATCGHILVTSDAKRLENERDRVLLELMSHASDNPKVTLAQIKFIAGSLADIKEPSEAAEKLRDACIAAASRLVDLVEIRTRQISAQVASLVGIQNIDLLDSMPDRASVIDREYRFVLTNKANARFHARDPADFVGRPAWTIVGTKCFEQLWKPSLDASFSGKETSHVASCEAHGQTCMYLVTYTPVRDLRDDVVLALVVARDVTRLGAKADVVWPAPDEE